MNEFTPLLCENLITLARHYCQKNYGYWCSIYTGNTNEDVSPRYLVSEAILQGVLTLVDKPFDSLADCKKAIIEQGETHESFYSPNHITKNHEITAKIPLATAVRASIADMYYLPPVNWQGQTLMGGVLNLTPIELACQLADTVYAKIKPNYDKIMAEPAIYSTFVFFANQRFADVHQYQTHDSQIH